MKNSVTLKKWKNSIKENPVLTVAITTQALLISVLIGSAGYIITNHASKWYSFADTPEDAVFTMNDFEIPRQLSGTDRKQLTTILRDMNELYNSKARLPMNIPREVTLKGDFPIGGIYPLAPTYKYATVGSYDSGTKNIKFSFSTKNYFNSDIWDPSDGKNHKNDDDIGTGPERSEMDISFYPKTWTGEITMTITYKTWDGTEKKLISVPTAHSKDPSGSMDDYPNMINALQTIVGSLKEGQKNSESTSWVNYSGK